MELSNLYVTQLVMWHGREHYITNIYLNGIVTVSPKGVDKYFKTHYTELGIVKNYFYLYPMTIPKMKKQYRANKDAKVGAECVCPSCNREFLKTSYQQAFCNTYAGTFCKDRYWNNVTPNKRCNTTRISPASQAWLISRTPFFDGDDDQSWDAHKDSF